LPSASSSIRGGLRAAPALTAAAQILEGSSAEEKAVGLTVLEVQLVEQIRSVHVGLTLRIKQDGLEAAGRLDAAIAGSHAPERDAARRRSSRA
jgi:hypothetical protein